VNPSAVVSAIDPTASLFPPSPIKAPAVDVVMEVTALGISKASPAVVAANNLRLARFAGAVASADSAGLKVLTLSDAAATAIRISQDGEQPRVLVYPPDSWASRECFRANRTALISASPFKRDVLAVAEKYFNSSEGPAHTFVEIGGLDGSPLNSMTEVLEKRLGWRGLVIEATPANYVSIGKNRPCVHHAQAAAGPDWSLVEFFGWGGCCSGIKGAMSPKFQKQFHGRGKVRHPKQRHQSEVPEPYLVQQAPISDIMAAAGLTTVDFWSLDVEGAEEFVLRGMDFTRVTIKVVLVEISETKAVADRVSSLLHKNGFMQDVSLLGGQNKLNALWLSGQFSAEFATRQKASR